MCIGMLPVILPAIRAEYGISLSVGVGLITLVNLIANWLQIAVGHTRSKKTKPFFIPLSLVLVSAMLFLGFIEAGDKAVFLLFALAGIAAVGVAIFHPEGLRAIHALDKISSPISTAVFLTGGFLGFSAGAFIPAALVYAFGLKGALWLLAFPVFGLMLIFFSRIRLAAYGDDTDAGKDQIANRISFWTVFSMAVPVASSTTVIISLLPTRLNELGFALHLGATPVMLFGFGSVAGSLFWAYIANRKGELFCCMLSSLLAIPFFLVYLFLISHITAILLLLPAGFCAAAAYTLTVSMARQSRGTNLGRKMGIIGGGAWGTASLVLMVLGPIAEKFGVKIVLDFAWIGYLISGTIGLYTLLRSGKNSNTKTSS